MYNIIISVTCQFIGIHISNKPLTLHFTRDKMLPEDTTYNKTMFLMFSETYRNNVCLISIRNRQVTNTKIESEFLSLWTLTTLNLENWWEIFAWRKTDKIDRFALHHLKLLPWWCVSLIIQHVFNAWILKDGTHSFYRKQLKRKFNQENKSYQIEINERIFCDIRLSFEWNWFIRFECDAKSLLFSLHK